MKGSISYFLSLTSGFTVILKSCVMVIYLICVLFWIGAVVAQPSIIESPATIPRNEITELSNSDFQIRKGRFKESLLVLRPVVNSGVDTTKLGDNGTSKLSGSGVVSIKPDVSKPT